MNNFSYKLFAVIFILIGIAVGVWFVKEIGTTNPRGAAGYFQEKFCELRGGTLQEGICGISKCTYKCVKK